MEDRADVTPVKPEPRWLVAPSGAGKTYLVDASGGQLIDADRIPQVRAAYTAVQDKYGRRWFDRPDYATVVRPLKDTLLANAFRMAATDVFKTYATAELDAVAQVVRSPASVLVWLPSAETLTQHQAAKTNTYQPRWTIQRNAEELAHWRTRALELGWPIVVTK